jgi:UDP-N-acetyl-D-glucosamine dehydrogenase
MELENKIIDRNFSVGIIGLGYVGLPLAILFQDSGFHVVGIDIDEEKIDSLKADRSYIAHIGDEIIAKLNTDGFIATTDFSHVQDLDAVIVCVPTPLNINREPDLSYINSTFDSVENYLQKNQIISIESTTYPGMTDELIAKKIENLGFEIGKDIFLVYSPEREDPGNEDYNTKTIPKVVGGISSACLKYGTILYSQAIDEVVQVSSTKVAEMTKLLENIQRSVNIGLMNEMKIIASEMDIDIHEVIRAASTKPFGFIPYHPGPGIGGHCIPIDPFYLSWKVKEYGLTTRFIDVAGEMNQYMPNWVVSIVSDALNERGKPIRNARILILGIAYKKNVDDMRESPATMIMQILKDKGALIEFSDPYFEEFPKLRNYDFNLKSIELTPESISDFDAVVLITDHDDFDYEMIIQNSKLVIDTRGIYQEERQNLIKA